MGKDSLVMLDMLVQRTVLDPNFRVYPYYLDTAGLAFIKRDLALYEQYFGIEIRVHVHPAYTWKLAHHWCRIPTAQAEKLDYLNANEVDAIVRAEYGCDWIASGEKLADSIMRHAMIVKCGGVDTKRMRVYPVGGYNKAEILAHIKTRHLPITRVNRDLGHSFTIEEPGDLMWLERNHPQDYKKLVEIFPLLPAFVRNYEIKAKAKTAQP